MYKDLFTLQTYMPAKTYPPNAFFIQSKGFNSGRPLKKPIANCFVCLSSNNDLIYNLVYCLFIGRMFESNIRGTAIPFITIKDTAGVILTGYNTLNISKLQTTVTTLNQIETLEAIKKQQLKEIKNLRVHVALNSIKH